MSKKDSKEKELLNGEELNKEEMGQATADDSEVQDNIIENDEVDENENSQETELEELKDKYIRLAAEFDNYRKRTLKEKMELSKSAAEKIFVNILPVIDDFDRALSHLEKSSDLDSLKEGVNLIYGKFMNFMSQNGVTEIDTFEQEFNMDLHEAITKSPAPSDDLKGKIIDCVEKGYMLGDKVIRFPKVVVGE